MEALHKPKGFPLRRAHSVGTSVVVTIDPTHVRRLGIDDMTLLLTNLTQIVLQSELDLGNSENR